MTVYFKAVNYNPYPQSEQLYTIVAENVSAAMQKFREKYPRAYILSVWTDGTLK